MENTQAPSNTSVADGAPINPILVKPTVFINTAELEWYQKITKKTWLYGSLTMLAVGVSVVIFSRMGTGGENIAEIDFNSAPPIQTESMGTSSGKENNVSESGNTDFDFIATDEINAVKGVRKVFKIEVYTLGVDGSYTYLSYGSAVHVGEKGILTNAHTLLGSDDLPTGKYNLCVTEVDTNIEKCITPLRLIKYDKEEDIALLEITEDVYLGEEVSLYEIKPAFGDSIKIYGYPKEGGESFRMSERKMSGAERGYYKIDDSIDQGYAGGAAFNGEGEFIGIPVGSADSASSLGYIIPNKVINDFLEGYSDTEKYQTNEEAFITFMKNMNDINQSGKISNEYFTFDSYKNLGLSVKDITLDSSGYGSYTLVSESEKTVLTITIPSMIGGTYFTFSGNILELEKSYRSVQVGHNIEENGRVLEEKADIEGVRNSNGTIDENVAAFGYRYNGIEYMIRTEAKNMDEEVFEGAKELYWKNFNILKRNTAIKQDTLEVYSGSFELPLGTYAIVKCGNRCTYDVILSENEKVKVTSFSNNVKEIAGRTLKDILAQTEKMYSLDPLDTNDFKILKNKDDHLYIFTRTKNQKGEIELSAIFYATEDEEKYSEYEFILKMNRESLEAEKKFFELIHSLRLSLTSPFLNDTVSENSEGIGETITTLTNTDLSSSGAIMTESGDEIRTESGELSESTPLAPSENTDESTFLDINEESQDATSDIIE